MPSVKERHVVDHFISLHNEVFAPKITTRQADLKQEAPDAICFCEDGTTVGLELTSVYPPKGRNKPVFISPYLTLSPLYNVLDRKFLNNYRGENIDQVWLVVDIRRTLPPQLIREAVRGLEIPDRFDRVYLQWPMLFGDGEVNKGLLLLPDNQLWVPQAGTTAA